MPITNCPANHRQAADPRISTKIPVLQSHYTAKSMWTPHHFWYFWSWDSPSLHLIPYFQLREILMLQHTTIGSFGMSCASPGKQRQDQAAAAGRGDKKLLSNWTVSSKDALFPAAFKELKGKYRKYLHCIRSICRLVCRSDIIIIIYYTRCVC